MIKFLHCIFILLALVIAEEVQAHQISLQLMPKASKLITNHYASTLTASCVINAAENKNKIVISVLENKGRINGKSLSKGQTTSLRVRNNQNISVSAEPGAQVNLHNAGAETVNATCYTS